MADIRKLTDNLSVAPQLSAADIADAQNLNYKSVSVSYTHLTLPTKA